MAEDNSRKIYELVEKWLQEYHSTSNPAKKTKLKAIIVTNMLPIIKRIARTIARRSYDPIDDMVQAGSIGLLKAIDSFSFTINKDFKSYAGSLIIGEIRHFIRDKLHAIRVPAYIQELSCRINSFIGTLTPEQLEEMTDENVASALKLKPKDVSLVKQSERRKSVVRLDEVFAGDTNSLGYEEIFAKTDYKETSNVEDSKLIIKDLINRLPNEYKPFIELYYYDDMNQKEIADTLNMSQMQVSRKMKKAFSLLHKMIANSYADIFDTGG